VPLAALLPDRDFNQIDGAINPYHGYDFERPGSDNKNLYIHTRAEAFPYNGSETARAVHILRLTSVLLGTLTVLACAAVFRLLFAEAWQRLLALSMVAFWAQFAYVSSVLNNDNLAILLVTLALLLVLQQQRHSYTWRRAFLLGVVLGAALLTKATLGLLVIPMALVTIFDRRAWRYAVLTAGVTALVAGWWYMRNWVLYGDPTSIGAILETWPGVTIREGEIAWDIGIGRAWYAYESLWARFGHGAVAVGAELYTFYNLLIVVVLAGIGVRLWQLRKAPEVDQLRLLTLLSFGVIWVFGVVYYSSISNSGNQGRYLLPGIAVWAAGIAYGLSAWHIPRRLLAIGVSGAMCAACLIGLFGYFFPSYQPLQVPDTHEPSVKVRYANLAELIGVSPENPTGQPGETIAVELYWRALGRGERDLQVYLHSAFHPEVVWRDSLPGLGHRPAHDWNAGEMWAERYYVTIPENAVAGTEYLLTAGLYQPQTATEVPATDANGEPLGAAPVVAVLRVE
jgi:hypothetical protein